MKNTCENKETKRVRTITSHKKRKKENSDKKQNKKLKNKTISKHQDND